MHNELNPLKRVQILCEEIEKGEPGRWRSFQDQEGCLDCRDWRPPAVPPCTTPPIAAAFEPTLFPLCSCVRVEILTFYRNPSQSDSDGDRERIRLWVRMRFGDKKGSSSTLVPSPSPSYNVFYGWQPSKCTRFSSLYTPNHQLSNFHFSLSLN